MRLRTKIILYVILLTGAFFRYYNLLWDQGYHMHPDERAIVLAVLKLSWPTSVSQFLEPTSPWNPHFFAYGSFPLYLLKIAGMIAAVINPLYAQYDLLTILGRVISATIDLGTIMLVFLLGRKVGNTKLGLLAAFLYSLSVLPTQLSHFYAVDTLLTFFITMTLFQLIRLYEYPSKGKAVLVGLFFGLSLATKISALVLLSAIGTALLVDFLLLFLKQPHKPTVWLPHLPQYLKQLGSDGLLILLTAGIVYSICEPYALISFQEFWDQNMQQAAMTKDAFTFPYTLQYVGKIPYLYELKNIFLYGEGPLIAIFSFLGALFFSYRAFIANREQSWTKEIILAVFFWIYFAIVGHFAVGFMRYMLPLYPLLSVFGAFFLYRCFRFLQTTTFKIKMQMLSACSLLFAISLFIWPLSFLQIYTRLNTRVQASQWIFTHIPTGSTLAVEHWDDQLPVVDASSYQYETLPLYDPDTTAKYNSISQQLSHSDYLIIASNRLYVPLQKLANCTKLPPDHCYPLANQYYKKLFAGKLGFKKVAEFTSFPTIPLLNIPINDQGADESFTVYDHPKVMIFQRTNSPLPTPLVSL